MPQTQCLPDARPARSTQRYRPIVVDGEEVLPNAFVRRAVVCLRRVIGTFSSPLAPPDLLDPLANYPPPLAAQRHGDLAIALALVGAGENPASVCDPLAAPCLVL